ncbi:MarR family winged helix-turn-helix transcriptional regulator [Thermicanus aegyptius]|uniref:MarR family winged helix-turn-helix transcriptional regulator n=1 Tax=Thermicanus aegyptius TaxID=94009 RepID=UPI00040AB2DA|nr:MarR family transcriptional regulator [Thermicanus aegyptius]
MDREVMIGTLIQLLHRFFRKIKLEMNQLDEELTVSDFHVLKIIHEESPVNISEIAKRLQVSLSHVTNISDRLINKGLIDRIRSHEDRRVVMLTILPRGEEMMSELQRRRIEYLKHLLENVSDEELEELITIFAKIFKS